MLIVQIASAFLIVCGLMFLAGVVLPRGSAPVAALRRRLELNGAFETAAALVSGVLFIVSGGAVMISLDRYG